MIVFSTKIEVTKDMMFNCSIHNILTRELDKATGKDIRSYLYWNRYRENFNIHWYFINH